MKKLNLNERIRFKLNPRGAEIFYHQYDELNETLKARGVKQLEPLMPSIDSNGFTEMQLWSFMELFGQYISAGKPNVLKELNLYIDEKDLKDVEEWNGDDN